MSRISREEVEHIARLARLSLGDGEAAERARDLDQMLDYVTELQALDTEGIEATAHAIPLPTPLREDRAVEGMDPKLALSNAPESEGTAFVVPKVIDGEDGG